MKTAFTYGASWLVAIAMGAAIAFAHIASATTLSAPVVGAATPSAMGSDGTDPLVPYRLGYIDSNHDEVDTTNGHVDLPF